MSRATATSTSVIAILGEAKTFPGGQSIRLTPTSALASVMHASQSL